MRVLPFAWLGVAVATGVGCQPSVDGFMAERITIALAPVQGEHAILRYHPDALPGLPAALERALVSRDVTVELMPYGAVRDFATRLDSADIYVWLPDPSGNGTPLEQQHALAEWLDAGRGRQIHFHWGAGTMGADGRPGEHLDRYDAVYLNALAIDYEELDRHQDAAIALLRSGLVHVTTPAGTNLSLEVGGRPFNKQNGDASRRRIASAAMRIDREIELPAGVIRVAPVETSVNGTIVVPSARFADGEAKQLTLTINGGVVTAVAAASGAGVARAALEREPALGHFRELGIGFNPMLRSLLDGAWVPYYGYGEGIVRLSLGNNEELGGDVRGSGVRWFFFPDATVRVGHAALVEDGVLVRLPHVSGFGGLLELVRN